MLLSVQQNTKDVVLSVPFQVISELRGIPLHFIFPTLPYPKHTSHFVFLLSLSPQPSFPPSQSGQSLEISELHYKRASSVTKKVILTRCPLSSPFFSSPAMNAAAKLWVCKPGRSTHSKGIWYLYSNSLADVLSPERSSRPLSQFGKLLPSELQPFLLGRILLVFLLLPKVPPPQITWKGESQSLFLSILDPWSSPWSPILMPSPSSHPAPSPSPASKMGTKQGLEQPA